MKLTMKFVLLSCITLLSGCAGHYSASTGHHHGVSVGVHGNLHGKTKNVVGALIVGGVIGHILTEAAHESEQMKKQKESDAKKASESDGEQANELDQMENGYSISDAESVKAEVNEEQSKFYQMGQDGLCYLMQTDQLNQTSVVAKVPDYSCR